MVFVATARQETMKTNGRSARLTSDAARWRPTISTGINLDRHFIIVSEMEQLFEKPALDQDRLAAACELMASLAPNDEVALLTKRIVGGLNVSGRRKQAKYLDANHLRDMVLRLRVSLEALKRASAPDE